MRVFSRQFTDEQRRALLTALEALCARPLDHPSIAKPVASGLAGTDVFVVHAYLDGVPMHEFVTERGAQLLADLLPHLTHAAAAIDYAAAAGVHHGALTGRDVIVSPERAAISGFGLVQALVDAGVTSAASGDAPSHADDVRALAVIALEALCGCEFSTIDVAATVMSLPGVAPNRLLDAFEAALSPYPDLRPKTALDFAARLQQAVAEVPGPAVPAAAVAPAETRVDSKTAVVAADHDAGDTLRRDADLSQDLPSDTVFRPEAALLRPSPVSVEAQHAGDPADAVFRDADPGGTVFRTPAIAAGDIPLPPPFLRDLEPPHEAFRLKPADEARQPIAPGADPEVRRVGRAAVDKPGTLGPLDVRRPVDADQVHSTVQLPVEHAHDAVADLPEAPARSRSWLPAVAAALLIGLGGGFAGGYMLGWRGATRAAEQAAMTAAPPEPAATSGRTFTDAPIGGDAPEHVPSASLPGTESSTTAPAPGGSAAGAASPELPARIEPAPPSAAPRPAAAREQEPRRLTGNGSLLIESRPTGAQVRVDGTIVGRTPLILADVAAGSHSIGLELSGYQRWATAITVEGGVRTRVAASLEQ